MRIEADRTRAFLADTLAALGDRRAPTRCCACSRSRPWPREAALEVTDLAMKVCGGAAFRKEVGVERRFRDARAARVMAPTTDALLDFIGRAVCGLPLLGGRVMGDRHARDRRRRLRPEGRHDLGRLPGLVPRTRTSPSTTSCTRTTSGRSRTCSRAASTSRGTRRWRGCAPRRLADAAGVEVAAVAMRDTDRDLTSLVVVRADGADRDARRPARPDRRRRRGRLAAGDAAPARPPRRARASSPASTSTVRRFDVGVGLHGDHVGGERDAARGL